MRLCGADFLKPGMVLAQPLFDDSYKKLLNEGVRFDRRMIERVKEMGFQGVYIEEPGTERIHPFDLVGLQTRRRAFEALNLTAETIVRDTNRDTKKEKNPKAAEATAVTRRIQDSVTRVVDTILNELMLQADPMYYAGVFQASDSLTNHSSEVAVLSALIGIKLQLGDRDMQFLTRAGLFHDVAKFAWSKEMLAKHPLDLDEQERQLYEKHPKDGEYWVDRLVSKDLHVSMAVLEHHERQDGKGFPEGMRGSGQPPQSGKGPRGTIHRYAEIISVANRFHNLISGQVERESLDPAAAIAHLAKSTPQEFNPHVVDAARNVIGLYSPCTSVKILKSGNAKLVNCRGIIAKTFKEHPHNPAVAVLYDGQGRRLSKPLLLDLRKDPSSELKILPDLEHEE